jgi:hypothetical protein
MWGSMKKLVLLSAVFFIFISGCSDTVDVPEDRYGVQGKIVDTSGIPIPGVEVYYLFNQWLITSKSIPLNFTATDSIFKNKLYQNFPNPVTWDTFIWFSVESKCYAELTFRNKRTNEVVYTFSDTLLYGLYQHYPGNFLNASSNAIYKYSLSLRLPDGRTFFDEKEMAVIKTTNRPAVVSGSTGHYFFNYKDSYIGDSISYSNYNDPDLIYKMPVEKEVYLYFKKDGYLYTNRAVHPLPSTLLNMDVVLNKETEL